MKQLFFLIAISLSLCACSLSNSEPKITHLPFKEDKDDRWGLIGVDGKILFEKEFENEPSSVTNGTFYVKNIDGKYEFYTAEKKPKKIGDKEYADVMPFIEDITFVAEPEQKITAINKDGSVAFKLDFFKNDEIISVENFSDGLALFKTRGGKYGYINTKGKVVIAPKFDDARSFSEGLAVVWDDENTAFVIKTSGKKQFDLKVKAKDGRVPFYRSFSDGLMACGTAKPESGDITTDYFVDKKGEKAFSVKDLVMTDFEYGYAVCAKWDGNGNGYLGLVDKKGDVVIRPKYDAGDLYLESYYGDGFITKDFVCLYDKDKFGLVDFMDNVICPFGFDRILPFYDGKHAFASQRDAYHLIDKNGKEVDKKEYAIVSQSYLKREVRSDFLDVKDAFDEIFANFGENKIGNIYLGETLEDVRKNYNILEKDKKSHNGEYMLRLQGIVRDDISSQYRAIFYNPTVSSSYNWFDTSYYFNDNTKIKYIIIGLKYNIYLNNLRERVDREFKKMIAGLRYEYSHNTEWNGMDWDIYIKPEGKYVLGISRKAHYDWGDYNIVISEINN